MFLELPHYALLLFALLMSFFTARCMLGSECNGGRCNLYIGLGTGEAAQPSQGPRAVARNTALLERKVRYAAGISAIWVFRSGS